MTVEEIKELIRVVNESGIAELEVQRGGDRVRIQRSYPPPAVEAHPTTTLYTLPPAVPAIALSPAPSAAPGAVAPPLPMAVGPLQPSADEKIELVKSPIVGTFYESPSPGSPPFVKPGDRVTVGQVICIIESMKLMNEIEAEVAGTLVARLVENGRPVEYGEALFSVKPS